MKGFISKFDLWKGTPETQRFWGKQLLIQVWLLWRRVKFMTDTWGLPEKATFRYEQDQKVDKTNSWHLSFQNEHRLTADYANSALSNYPCKDEQFIYIWGVDHCDQSIRRELPCIHRDFISICNLAPRLFVTMRRSLIHRETDLSTPLFENVCHPQAHFTVAKKRPWWLREG